MERVTDERLENLYLNLIHCVTLGKSLHFSLCHGFINCTARRWPSLPQRSLPALKFSESMKSSYKHTLEIAITTTCSKVQLLLFNVYSEKMLKCEKTLINNLMQTSKYPIVY